MYELEYSLHGCQETKILQNFQKRLTITWQDISSIKNSIAAKIKILQEIIRLSKSYQELAGIIKNYQAITRMSETIAPVRLLTKK